MRLVLLGPPGAGKGSQAHVLSQRLHLAHIASGDLLREAVEAQTPVGRDAQGYLQRGALVPDPLVTAMVLARVSAAAPGPGFVLDGFPRTRAQAAALDEVVGSVGAPIDRVLYLETSAEVVGRRLSGRRVCRSCGVNYHATNRPPRQAGVCDACGGPVAPRSDDRPETIAQRVRVYEAQTAPVLADYRDRGILRVVDGNLSVEALSEALMALFQRESLLPRPG